MKKKIIVLGAGLIGSAIANDLCCNYDVTSVDINPGAFIKLKTSNIKTLIVDLSETENIQSIIEGFDLVIGAVPGYMGFKTLETVIRAGKNIVDISFMPEDFMVLDALAKKYRVVAVVDCGVAPGMGNIILGHFHSQMDIESYKCFVGGLPVIREWPYEYKAVFSPIDVIEEYIRPARYVQNYELVTREALSEPELLDFQGIGTLEAWNSDGLRSLIQTMKISNMVEKTLRYPGCIEYLKVLRESGFFSNEPIEINGVSIRPIDVTAKLLFPKWQLKEGEEDFTVMQIIIEGKKDGRHNKISYFLHDKYDHSTNTISMARTTGYTCTAVANLMLDGSFNRIGVNPPEFVGAQPGNLFYIMRYLKERGVVYQINEEFE